MAIENLESEEIIQQEVKTQSAALIPFESGFTKSNVWMAGMLKVRSPLIDESMTLYGFIGENDKLNFDEFKVNGMKISFADKNERYHPSESYKIYPKVLADLKQNDFEELFPLMHSIPLTADIRVRGCAYSHVGRGRMSQVNYYFFESNIHPAPSVASDEIYLVCKYKKEGETQYALFAPHEVMLDNQ